MFYNTINITGDELNDFRGKTITQSEKILAYFKRHPFNLFTPIEIYNAMGKRFLLTSVRRSMSDLTEEGYLVKTDKQAKELYGAPNYKWRLNVGAKVNTPPAATQLKLF